MNRIVRVGFSAYLIVMKNKIVTSVMMLMGGIMMAIAGFSGKGNDTKTMPSLIMAAGAVFTCWAFYRIGFIRAKNEKLKGTERAEGRKALIMQICETLLYVAITLVGLFLLLNEGFTNRILNLMTGGFTILNAVFGTIYVIKNRANHQTFFWRFRLGLTLVEYGLGLYFLFAPDSINSVGFAIMGTITTIAGVIEVFSSLTKEQFEKTLKDGKDIVKVVKEEKKEVAEESEPVEEEENE